MQKITILFFFLIAICNTAFSEKVLSSPEEVETAIKTGNASLISKHFSDNIDLKVIEKEDVYSKSQAELIIKDFFTKHPVKSFNLMHKSVSKGNSQYSIGKLETSNGSFRIYFLMKKEADKLLISQFRIESENE